MRDWIEVEHDGALRAALEPTARDLPRWGYWWDQQFLTWALNDARPGDGGPPLAVRAAGRPGLNAAERDIAGRVARARLGVHRVIDALPGAWIHLEPLEGGEPVRAMSETVSTEARGGGLLLGRLMDGPPEPSLWGPARLFGADTARRWHAWLSTLPPMIAADPATTLALLRFEPDDHAEPLPDGLALAEAVFDIVADDLLVIEDLEDLPQVTDLGLEIGAGDDVWAFAWLAVDAADAVDLGGHATGDGRVEVARIVVDSDRLTVRAAGAAILADVTEQLERRLAGLATRARQQRLQAA